MISILPEHISLRLLFAQRKMMSYPKEATYPGSSRRETGEEVFHRLREAIAQITANEINLITTLSSFEELFPRKNRKEKLKELKKITGYSIQLLRPKLWIYYVCAFLFLLSLVGLFINGTYGLIGILFTTLLFYVGHKTGEEFIYPTIGEAAEKITIDQLIQSNHSTF